jgi:Transposase DDE domain
MSVSSWRRYTISRYTTSRVALCPRSWQRDSVWKRFLRLSRFGVFGVFFEALAQLSARRRIWCRCSTAPWRVRMFRQPARNQALGGSRGGFSCKIHLKTDLDGLPIGFHLTGGEISDSTQFKMSLDMGPDIKPRAAMTDKGHDSHADRTACRERGIVPVIPYRDHAKNRPNDFPRMLYKGRARIEQAMGKLKRFKRVPLRCEKTATSCRAIVAFAYAKVPVESVHTA